MVKRTLGGWRSTVSWSAMSLHRIRRAPLVVRILRAALGNRIWRRTVGSRRGQILLALLVGTMIGAGFMTLAAGSIGAPHGHVDRPGMTVLDQSGRQPPGVPGDGR